MVLHIVLVCAFLFFCIGLSRRNFSTAIFNLIWMIMFALLTMRSYDELRRDTTLCLMIMFFAVNAGMIFYPLFDSLKSKSLKSKTAPKVECKYETIDIKIFSMLLLFCSAIIFLYFVRTVIAVGGLNLNSIRTINSSSSENKAFSGLIDTIAFYFIAEPLFLVLTLAFVYMIFSKQPRGVFVNILFCFATFAYFVTTAGRVIIICMFCFIFAAYITLSRKSKQGNIKFGKIIVIAAIAVLFLNLMTNSRTSDESTFVQQGIDYMTGSIYHMDQLMSTIELHRNKTTYFGTVAYGGFLYYPLKLINMLFGTNIQNASEVLQYMQKITVLTIGNKDLYFNALAPNAFYYYFDSHYLGIVIFSFISGVVAARAEKFSQRGGFMDSAILGVVYYCLVFSPLGSQCWKPLIPVTIFWLFFLKKWIVQNKEKQEKTICR